MPDSEAQKIWTVLDLLNWTARFFEKKGIDAPRLNAELLLAHVLGRSRIELYTHFSEVPTPQARQRFRELVLRRGARCPIQYLLGKAEFRSLDFLVDPSVLIPRPETELLLDVAIESFKAPAAKPAGPVVDLGTGSGAIAVCLALELPSAELIATDASTEALQVARQNAQRHGVAERILFMQGDLFEPIRRAGLAGRVAGLLSNPPYVAERDYPTLMPEVRDYEPAAALKAGPDGLDCYRRIAREAGAILASGALLALEVGFGQSAAVSELLRASGAFAEPQVRKDFQQIDRVIVCARR